MSDAGSPVDHPDHREDDEVDAPQSPRADDAGDESDLLSEIDEEQFDDYEEESKPVEIDENVAMKLKAKRKASTDTGAPKKKEGRRPKKRARGSADVDGDDDGERRPRKARTEGERRTRDEGKAPEPENEDHLTPEERRRRALDRAIDAAVKNPVKRRRKKDEIDLEEEIDEQMADLKMAMEKACVADNEAREQGQPAVNKLKLLPKVTALLNRTAIQDSVLDPETNFLQSVKYFLEPLNDGSLPAYNIQRDIFAALARLPINKETLLSSGIGKVILFYTRSKRPEPHIKRTAERLLGEWSRPILKRTDDYKKRHVETREFDINAAKLALQQEASGVSSSQITLTQRPAGKSKYELERERALARDPINPNRAQRAGLPASYTIAPKSTFDGNRAGDHRPIGAGGIEAFRKMTQKGKGRRN
ncbi:transcription factor iws-1 [Rhypophila decipiens]|uniref:Transcription factor iws-1 n=1 Tax=Rhypophila decipiens TaxID=261697 RepID=A0AAN6YGJ7_9PEZI|nr:transcription factor iws-1 [Rhypophila decipiens]